MSSQRHDGQWWLMVACFWIGLFMLIASSPALLPLAILVPGYFLIRLFRRKSPTPPAQSQSGRECLTCNYRGAMGTVLGSTRGGLLAFLLFLAALVPGVLYIIWRWNTPKCPRCGSVKTIPSDFP